MFPSCDFGLGVLPIFHAKNRCGSFMAHLPILFHMAIYGHYIIVFNDLFGCYFCLSCSCYIYCL